MSAPEYPDATLEYVQAQGWSANITKLRDGVHMIAGSQKADSGSKTMLLLVVCEPEKQVTEEHLQYLLKTGRQKNVDLTLLTYTVEFTENTRNIGKEHGIGVIDSENVRSHTESSDFGVDTNEIQMPESESESQTNLSSNSLDPVDSKDEMEEAQNSIQPKNTNDSGHANQSFPNGSTNKNINDITATGCVVGGVLGLISLAFPYAEGINLFEFTNMIEASGEPLIAWSILISVILASIMLSTVYFHDNAWIAELGGLLQLMTATLIMIIFDATIASPEGDPIINIDFYSPSADTMVSLFGLPASIPMDSDIGHYILWLAGLISVGIYQYFDLRG